MVLDRYLLHFLCVCSCLFLSSCVVDSSSTRLGKRSSPAVAPQNVRGEILKQEKVTLLDALKQPVPTSGLLERVLRFSEWCLEWGDYDSAVGGGTWGGVAEKRPEDQTVEIGEADQSQVTQESVDTQKPALGDLIKTVRSLTARLEQLEDTVEQLEGRTNEEIASQSSLPQDTIGGVESEVSKEKEPIATS